MFDFPRVADKLAMMAAEIRSRASSPISPPAPRMPAAAATSRPAWPSSWRARVAWAAADNALQIHGGNGFALEYPISRVLCDARILNIFEGAAEIQAQVIARRLLEEGN